MATVWYTNLRSGAGRFVRMDSARSALLGSDMPLIARAAAFAAFATLLVLALLIIVPLVVFGGVVFLASLGVMRVRSFLARAFGSLPRHDADERRNVRVRLPSESSEPL